MRRLKPLIPVFVSAAALAAAGPARGQDAKPSIPDDVKAHIQARIDQGRTAAVMVGLVGPGGEVYHGAGVLKLGKPEPVDPDSIFEIGSITKAFTGILLADMVHRGEVKLDDPVRKYLPDSVRPPEEDSREITLADLATHRSSLPRLPSNMSPADPDDPYVDYTAEQLYAYLNDAKLPRPIGSAYEYSNLGMGLLGHALSRAAKTDYNTLVRKRIAGPLGMTATSTQVDPAATKRVVQGYEESEGKLVPAKAWTWRNSTALTGAGGLHSTAREMVRFLTANIGLAPSKLSAAIVDARLQGAEAGSPQAGVGLGWHLRKKESHVIVWQNGATGGFHAFCGFDPDSKMGVVVLSSSTADIDDIGVHLLDSSVPLAAIEKVVPVEEPKLARLDGWYDLGSTKIRVTHEGSQLFAQFSGQGRYPVFPKSETLFVYRVVPATLEFDVQADGSVSKVTLHQAGKDLAAKRMPPETAPRERVAVKVDPKILAEYVGRYALTADTSLEVRLRDDHLSCQLTGQQAFDAYAESPTSFFLSKVDAQLTFERDSAGKVAAVILHQGGKDQKATRAN